MAKEDKKAEKDEEKEEKESAHKEESESEEGGEGEGGKKKLSKKMLIILAAVGVLVMGGGTVGALFLTGVLGGHNKEEAVEHKEGELKGAAVFFPLGDILVNLNGEGKRPNFLKIKVTLELADEKDVPLMTSLKPRIIDNFQVYLRELRIEDLRGSAGLYRLREELLLRVTEAAQPVRVRDVLFQEILVQ